MLKKRSWKIYLSQFKRKINLGKYILKEVKQFYNKNSNTKDSFM